MERLTKHERLLQGSMPKRVQQLYERSSSTM